MVLNSIQKGIATIFNGVYRLTGIINEKHRDVISFLLWMCIFGFMSAKRSEKFANMFFLEYLSTPLSQFMFSTILFFLICCLNVNNELKPVKWKRGIIYLQILIGIAIILISFLHPVGSGYRLFGIQLVVVFPCFFFIWNNRKDYDKLFWQVSMSMVIVGLLLFIATILYAFQGELFRSGEIQGRCDGIMGNANVYSLLGMELVLGSVYLMVSRHNNAILTILYYVSIGIGTGIILTGKMRIAIATIFICFIVVTIYKLAYFHEKIDVRRCIKGIVGILITTVMISSAFLVIDINVKHMDKSEGQELQKQLEEHSGIGERISVPSEGGVDSFSSGRTWIWRNYARTLNLLGHNYDNYDKEKMTGPHYGNAHNIFFEMSYRYGVPIAVAFLIYMFINGCVCLKYLFARKEKKELYLLFPIITAIVFLLETVLDCALLPFFQPEALIYYVSLAVVIDKSK